MLVTQPLSSAEAPTGYPNKNSLPVTQEASAEEERGT